MIFAVDASVLLHMIDPNLPVPPDASGEVPSRCADRIEYLLDCMGKNGDRMIVPTPTLAEVLINAGNAGPQWLNVLHRHKAVRVAPFDEKSAIECAAMSKDRARRKHQSTRNKAKFDEQIVAIAITERAEIILSDDSDIRALAPSHIVVKGIGELDLPPEDPQAMLL